jgi:hypothetical protein
VAVEEAEGSIAWESVEEVALEEEGEVPDVSRRLHLKGATGIEASNLSAGIEELALRSTAKRRAIMTVLCLGDCYIARRFISPAVVVPRVCGLCIFTWSSDRALTRAVGVPAASGGP